MRHAAIVAVIAALWALTIPMRAAAQYSNLEIPTAADGYTITTTLNTSENAPAGYTGHIEKMEQLAVGDKPEVIGRTYKSRFVLSNEIRNCPKADGTAEGDGEFTVGGTFTHTVGTTTFSSTYAMTAKAKYKGKVGDDGFLDGPVTADIDYAYSIAPTPSPRIDPISPLATSITQHITIQFEVARGKLEGPNIGAFTGGDPTKGELNHASTMGWILSYWAGVWYTFAQLNWLTPNNCVQVVFDPPSFTRQPVPSSEVKVNAYIKTKGGEGVRGIVNVSAGTGEQSIASLASTGEKVSISSSSADPESPAIFYYTAPNKKLPHMGFGAFATSRGGNANATWEAGLGTDWSGEITVSQVSEGDVGQNELQFWSNSESWQSTIIVKDGVATAHSYHEGQHIGINKERAARNGAITLIDESSSNVEESADAGGKAPFSVELSEDGTYTLVASFGPSPPGKRHETSCTRTDCTTTDTPLPVSPWLPQITGKYDNPNLLQGSQSSTKTNQGRSKKGTTTYNLTWYLARQGTTK
jgi:hypothetical protein